MEEFKELQDMWQSQVAEDIPAFDSVKEKNKIEQKSMRKKFLMGIASLAGPALLIVYFLIAFDFNLVTTKLSMLLMLFAICAAIYKMIKMNKMIKETESITSSPKQYLASLKGFEKAHTKMQTTFLKMYFLLFTVALAFYIFEFYQMNKTIGIIAYCLTGAWILFCYFYIHPRLKKKNDERIASMISRVEGVEESLGS